MKNPQQSKQMLRLLFWESTIKCNLNCAHCRRLESGETATGDLTSGQGKDLIKQLAELGQKQPVMPVLVFSGGEPLCREDLFKLACFAKSQQITSALATNGTLIDSAVAQKIKKSEIARVAVSVDGATAEVHDRLRRVQGAFERTLEGIGHLREENIAFQINVTLTKHNAEQLEDIYRLAQKLDAVALHIFMLVPVGCGRTMAQTDMLGPTEYEQKLLEICKLERRGKLQLKVTCGPHYQRVIRQQGLHRDSEVGEHPVENSTHASLRSNVSKGCLAGLGVLFAGHQGDVFPCGYLPVKCGNILEQNLSDIWYNNKDLAVMCDSSALEGKCGACGYREVCGGCRARAYAATGNYMAEEPFCAYVPPEAVD